MARQRKPKKTGPKEATLRIEGSWKDAIRTAIKKKRPAGGWPKSDASKRKAGK